MVHAVEDASRFSDLTSFEQAKKLFGSQIKYFETHGALYIGRCQVAGKTAEVVLTDRKVHGGTFGFAESTRLSAVLKCSRDNSTPIILLLDSGGARLTEGYKALGAFRLMFAEILKARLEGQPMMAIVLKNCFGGASMIAASCGYRLASRHASYGMSGPKIIRGIGNSKINPKLKPNVATHYLGGVARLEAGAFHDICDDRCSAYKAKINHFLLNNDNAKLDLSKSHVALGNRLLGQTQKRLIEPKSKSKVGDGNPVGVREAYSLADNLLRFPDGGNLSITLNSPSHIMTLSEEKLVLSDFLSHVGLCIADAKSRDISVEVIIDGLAGGGIYVALCSVASVVKAKKNSKITLLPKTVVGEILGADKKVFEGGGSTDLLKSRVVDEILNS